MTRSVRCNFATNDSPMIQNLTRATAAKFQVHIIEHHALSRGLETKNDVLVARVCATATILGLVHLAKGLILLVTNMTLDTDDEGNMIVATMQMTMAMIVTTFACIVDITNRL